MDFHGFDELAEEFEDLAESYREEYPTPQSAETGNFQSSRSAIQAGMSDGIEKYVLPTANEDASKYTDTNDPVKHDGGEWISKYQYLHRVYSEDDMVAFHEFGTGTKAEHPWIPGTIDVGGKGYIIEPNGDYPLAINIGGQTVFVEYVVHPGVEAQHFIEKAIKQSTEQVEYEIQQKLIERFQNLG